MGDSTSYKAIPYIATIENCLGFAYELNNTLEALFIAYHLHEEPACTFLAEFIREEIYEYGITHIRNQLETEFKIVLPTWFITWCGKPTQFGPRTINQHGQQIETIETEYYYLNEIGQPESEPDSDNYIEGF